VTRGATGDGLVAIARPIRFDRAQAGSICAAPYRRARFFASGVDEVLTDKASVRILLLRRTTSTDDTVELVDADHHKHSCAYWRIASVLPQKETPHSAGFLEPLDVSDRPAVATVLALTCGARIILQVLR
jgi:hypothetical protein